MARNKVWTSGLGYRNTLPLSASLSRWMRRLVNCYRIFIIKLWYLYRKSYTECNSDKSMDRSHEEYAKWKNGCDRKSFMHNLYLILWKSNNWSQPCCDSRIFIIQWCSLRFKDISGIKLHWEIIKKYITIAIFSFCSNLRYFFNVRRIQLRWKHWRERCRVNEVGQFVYCVTRSKIDWYKP